MDALLSQSEEPTQCTQGAMDPRRMGRNNSGLSDADISDVMCILHPCSPAAFSVVAKTAERAPHNVLQNDGFADYDDDLTRSVLEEQETFILNTEGSTGQAMDLALRFTTDVINTNVGFVFGRNRFMCDIVLANDTYKRVSNMHFGIYMNSSGVLMLQDMSTNGTMVDDVVLKGKQVNHPQTRMLSPGSIIQILSPKPDEIVKFIVRIPAREGHEEQYESRFKHYMHRMALAQQVKAKQQDMLTQKPAVAETKTQSVSSYKAPMTQNPYGMHWSGGEKYNVVGLIGKGAFATVYQLATKSEGQLFAAKELEKRKFMKNGVLDRKLDNEMQIMKAISHPNVVQYVDYQDYSHHLYIIMEFVPCGDMQKYLHQRESLRQGPMEEFLGNKMAYQVLDSLNYLHAKKITHRDIKPDNILIANLEPAYFTVKLTDFGLSKVVKDNDTFLKTFCGTLLYCAPEVFPHYDAHVAGRGQKRTRKGPSHPPTKFHSYSQSVDIWSFGAVLWYSLCLKPPFEGVADNTGRGMFEKIMMTPLDHGDLVKQGIDQHAIDLLLEMLNTDPASRPSPRQCLQHKWFELVTQTGEESQQHQRREIGMFAIDEEDEAELTADPDLSQLSLGEQGGSYHSEDSNYDEASIHSGSMDFFDPRQSKRLKSDAFLYREQGAEMVDSSPELLHQSIPIIHQPGDATTPQKPKQVKKLFGEISQSALNAPASLGAHASAAAGNDGSSENRGHDSGDSALAAQHTAMRQAGATASPSLLGAESLLRDVHMESPQGSAGSLVGEPNEPTTPRTPGMSNGQTGDSKNGTPGFPDDVTPKQAQQAVFSRQINIPLPVSFWFDPADESTHNLDYASKVSRQAHNTDPSYLATKTDGSLGDTTSGSTVEYDLDEQGGGDTDAEPDVPALLAAEIEFIKPPPRLGKLTSTPDSFAPITLNLTNRNSTWGRAPSNSHVYSDKSDTRVPKKAFTVYFHSRAMEKAPETADWTKLDGLHCGISTESSSGIFINGVELKRAAEGKSRYGRIYTGDEITIWRPGSDRKPGLKFVCEFFHGEAKERRSPTAPRFVVETDGADVRRSRSKGKGKEKENVLYTDKLAVAA